MAKLFASETAHEVAVTALRAVRRGGHAAAPHRRAPLPRHAAHDHRRGHQRDPAHAHRAPARRAPRRAAGRAHLARGRARGAAADRAGGAPVRRQVARPGWRPSTRRPVATRPRSSTSWPSWACWAPSSIPPTAASASISATTAMLVEELARGWTTVGGGRRRPPRSPRGRSSASRPGRARGAAARAGARRADRHHRARRRRHRASRRAAAWTLRRRHRAGRQRAARGPLPACARPPRGDGPLLALVERGAAGPRRRRAGGDARRPRPRSLRAASGRRPARRWCSRRERGGAGPRRRLRGRRRRSAVGLAQAAFEAALRYSQQRTTFGQPLCQHQAVQLKLADMATGITAARLLTYARGGGPSGAATRAAAAWRGCTRRTVAVAVTLESMRIHGGYGYVQRVPRRALLPRRRAAALRPARRRGAAPGRGRARGGRRVTAVFPTAAPDQRRRCSRRGRST